MIQFGAKPKYKVFFYKTVNGKEPVRVWLQSLDENERFQLGQLIFLLQLNGPQLPMPHSRTLGNGLYELRERIAKVRYRIFYAFDEEKVAVLLHAVVKDQPTVDEDIALARNRLKEYFERKYENEN